MPGHRFFGGVGNDELDDGRVLDHRVCDEGDTFRYCEGNVVEVPSGIRSAK